MAASLCFALPQGMGLLVPKPRSSPAAHLTLEAYFRHPALQTLGADCDVRVLGYTSSSIFCAPLIRSKTSLRLQ